MKTLSKNVSTLEEAIEKLDKIENLLDSLIEMMYDGYGAVGSFFAESLEKELNSLKSE